MKLGLSIGTVLGIRVRLHPSWFLVFALVILSLVAVGVPGEEELPNALRWLLAIVVATLFFGSVLVHELAHALAARRRGLAVDEITLFIFGGPPSIEQDARDARSEAIIAGAGPLVSIVLAGLGFALWAVTGDAAGDAARVASGVGWWLGMSNVVLCGFNLIPAFPMDGGRMLRALMWRVTGDNMRATRFASLAGRAFGYGLIAGGFALALSGAIVLGIWLAFIGWFLNQAAQGTYRRVEFTRLVDGIRVSDVMEQEVAVVGPNLTLDTLVEQHLMSGRASLYPVTMEGTLVGTVDIAQVSRVPRSDWPVTRVTDVMTRGEEIQTLTRPASVMDAMTRFEETGAPAIAVVAEDDRRELLGLVTRDGLLRALRHRAVLRPYRGGERP
ncbi:MAG TPA: site-2 protease family protein [Candidatus Caenarcaniphilales bacterium]|nr:site-2 protease family protein [Candidatus Caenarcaniphilales bacterium]